MQTKVLTATATMLMLSGLTAACGSSAPGAGEATASQSAAISDDTDHSWLALGDSIAFGYDPTVANPTVASSFIGYPDVVGTWTDTADSNAGCPGETSASFLDTTKPDNGCQYWRAHFPLHVSYAGSQMAYAVSYLATHKKTKHITFNMGANDLFLLQATCEGQNPTNPSAALACITSGLPGTLQAYGNNVATAFGTLTAAGFKGQLVALTTYSTDYNNALDVQALTALNGVLTQVAGKFGFAVADGYGAFQKAAQKLGGGDACKAGLLIKLPDGTCNIHPNEEGREILAAEILSVAKFH